MMVGPWAFADLVDPVVGDAPRCPSCGEFIGLLPWLPPYRIRLVEGTRTAAPADVITSAEFTSFIASQRFVTEFARSGLTGVERWEPVEIEGYNDYEGNSIPSPAEVNRAYAFAVLPAPTARAKLEDMNAEYEGVVSCKVCGIPESLDSFEGIVLDETSWSGADLFGVTNLGQILVTERVVEFCERGEFTGVRLLPAADYIPFGPRRRRRDASSN